MAIVAIKDINKVTEFLKYINSIHVEQLSSFELNSNIGLSFIKKHFNNIQIPFNNNYPWYVIFELSFLKDINIDSILDRF